MELPQPRPFGTEGGGRKPTHDFLSLYSPVQQDPRPSPQGDFLKTHDFLQPLERVGSKSNAKEEVNMEKTSLEKPPRAVAPTSSVEHILPGGIGTYSISHVSYFNQRIPKPEGAVFTVAQASSPERNDENSNCSSYSGSGFTLWEEPVVVKKGKTGKENNITVDKHVGGRDAGVKIGEWTPSEWPSQSFSSHQNNVTFSSLSSSQPPMGQKNQSFIDIIKSAKSACEEEDEDDEQFILKEEPSSHYKGNLTIKVDGKSIEQKANTPRSKHSATEQRRRSKINDRFQMLREIIPHSDQKRDKASFLLEVIEYIQYLQEKVQKYEGPYQGWNHDPAKLMGSRNSERLVDQSQVINSGSSPALIFSPKFEENNVTMVSPTIPRNQQNPVESDMSTATTTFNTMEHHPRLSSKVVPLPIPMLQPNILIPGGTSGGAATLVAPRLASDAENKSSQLLSQSLRSRSCATDCAVASDKLKEQELTIESGTVSISSAYSQGLLNTLTQALQSSGVDLSQASVSVQIDLGKRANCRPPDAAATSLAKDDDDDDDDEVPSGNQVMTTRSRVASRGGEDSDRAMKRHKGGKN